MPGDVASPCGTVVPCTGPKLPEPAPIGLISGLCLLDGSPIALAYSPSGPDNASCPPVAGTPALPGYMGWINLANPGVVIPGNPPAGYRPCGAKKDWDYELLCAVDAAGVVVGSLALILRWDETTLALESKLIELSVLSGFTGDPFTLPAYVMPAGSNFGGCEPFVVVSPLYEELFRLDWSVSGQATPSTGADTPIGFVVGDAGDQLTVRGPVQSIQWHWLEQTAPIADPNDPAQILNPTVMVNGMAHIARVPNPLFNQPFSHERGVSYPETLLGDWVFETMNGAYIEIRVLRKAA